MIQGLASYKSFEDYRLWLCRVTGNRNTKGRGYASVCWKGTPGYERLDGRWEKNV